MTVSIEKPHTSNPKVINLSKLPKERIARGIAAFQTERLAEPELTTQEGEQEFYFEQAAGPNNGHAGMTYTVYVGRKTTTEPVTGWCSCAFNGLCKHLCYAYLVAKRLIMQGLAQAFSLPEYVERVCCDCGKDFEVAKQQPSDYCFDCLTEPGGAGDRQRELAAQEALDRDYEDVFGTPRPKKVG